MNNEKIGRFISEERKARDMTQKDLGDKLNVTDKAVSKWERGLSYPDISLLVPLSDTLGVTINELLNGEKGPDAKDAPETEATVKNVLQYADKTVKSKTKSIRRRVVVVGLVMLIPWIVIWFALAFYPNIARRLNANVQRRGIVAYQESVENLSQEDIAEHFRRAKEHNETLRELPLSLTLQMGVVANASGDYASILNVGGLMGWLEIPTINALLPIIHGTSAADRNRGIGHLEGTAFPIGGEDNHAVLLAHSNLSHSRGFSYLELLEPGDMFYVTVLDRLLVYEVYHIAIILPHEIDALRIIPGEDIVTLVTDHPAHVNSHRLLVRGRRAPDA